MMLRLKERYPTFKLEDEFFGPGGGGVVDTIFGQTYGRRAKAKASTAD
jgi:hypothetical protein